jgi:hypothetical protein
MYKTRQLTRDLLLEYDSAIMPPRPRAAGLKVIYPWENIMLSNFAEQLFEVAKNSGFIGDQQLFTTNFGSFIQNKDIIYDLFKNFPEIGDFNKLYFDLNEKILYYWDNEYIPINAMLIAQTTLNGGEA